MDHLHEHQRSTIDRHHEFENQGFGEEPQAQDQGDDEPFHHQDEEEEQGDGEGDADVDGDGDGEHDGMVDLDDEEHASGGQLTISYQGETYLFESVLPEKAQVVLTLLGGQEMPSFVNAPSYISYPKSHQGGAEASASGQRLNPREREEYIRRYREKRERRVWGKRILYSVRSSVAVKMNRHKGQFAPFKLKEEESEQKPALPSPPVETVCQGCGCASGTTPMMRKGPAGPKTLCNACGLMWANKGVLKSSQLREHKTQPQQQLLQQQQLHTQQSDLVAYQDSSPKISRGTKRKSRAT